MSITNVHIAIKKHLQTITVDTFIGESFVDGEYIPQYVTGVSMQLASFPITRRDLDFFPQGEYTFQDRRFYEIGAGTIQDKSVIMFGGDKYLVDGGTMRNFAGGFTTYLTKRISDSL